MSGIDTEVFNTLERAVSGDLNDLQSIEARFLSEMARFEFSEKRVADPLAETVVNVILGGLLVTPNGNDVSVSAGAMAQYSPTMLPAPGPLDSLYRLSRTSVSTTVAMPAPGATTYYLVEAQMVEVVTLSQNRDIYNPGTSTFAPALVTKQTERQIAFQVVVGGANAPAPTGGDWVPIAIVRRPGGGGPVASSDIIDVRRLLSDRRSPAPALRRAAVDTVTPAANEIACSIEFDGAGGRRAVVGSPDGSAAAYLSPSTVLAASTTYYAYLAPWSAFLLAPRQFGTVQYEGVFVVSDVAPASGGTNGGALDLPPPFGVLAIPAGQAYHVATLIRNSTNTDWIEQRRVADLTLLAVQQLASVGWATGFAPPVIGANNVPLLVPADAKTVILEIEYVGGAGAPTPVSGQIDPGGASTFVLAPVRFDDGSGTVQRFEVPIPSTASVDVTLAGGPINAGTVMTVRQVGWRE